MATHHPEFEPFLAAMADAPGESTNLLVFADWLDEHDRPALAQAVRAHTPRLQQRYERAAACLDALLGVSPEIARPYPLPRPDRGPHRSRGQWRRIVRTALKPFRLSNVTVASAPGWRGGPDVELRLPGADFAIADTLAVPWGVTSAELLAAGVLAFAALMPRLFPDEPARVVHDEGESFGTTFWRVAVRPQL